MRIAGQYVTLYYMSTTQTPARRHAHTIGNKYAATQDLDLADISKLIRSDIKAAQKAGALDPAIKASVRLHRYSGGASITATLTVPGLDRTPAAEPDLYQYVATTVQVAAHDAVQSIVDAYNWDNSDSMTDYYANRFFGFVNTRGTEPAA